MLALLAGIYALLSLPYAFWYVQQPYQPPTYQKAMQPRLDSAWFAQRIDSLRARFGQRKTFAPPYELEALLALSYFPELDTVPIDFVLDSGAWVPVASRPVPQSLLQGPRRYQVIISANPPSFLDDARFDSCGFNARVGVLGHELAHTLFYAPRSSLEVAWMGLCYPWDFYRRKFEKDTDRRAIQRGLGHQHLAWQQYINQKTQGYWLANYLNSFYLNETEIRQLMAE